MLSFFNWFFFSISLIAVTVLVHIEDNVSRGLGYGICAICMIIALLVLLGGTRKYRFKAPAGSPATHIGRVFYLAWTKRKLPVPEDASKLCNMEYWAEEKERIFNDRIAHTDQFRFLDKAATVVDTPACNTCTVTKVEEVKIVLRMLPIAASTILFYTVHAQMLTFSVEQGATLNRRIGKHFMIPPASLSIFLQTSILSTIILYDRGFVPVARRWTGRMQGITTLQRMGVGLVLCTISMVVAAMVERERLRLVKLHGLEDQPKAEIPMSVFYLVPQYLLVGAGEAFTYIAQLDFFYREAPQGMRSMGTALCLSTLSLGYFSSSGLVGIVNKLTKGGAHEGWLADSLNRGRLDNFYWFLAVLSFMSFLAYLGCAHWYQSRHKDDCDADASNLH